MHNTILARRIGAAIVAVALCAAVGTRAQAATLTVDANVALSSLVAIGDGQLRAVADALETFAATPVARSGDWSRIRAALNQVRFVTPTASVLYARPDGHYWTLVGGSQKANIADRAYFKAALEGHPTIGQLVTSRSTGKAVAVIAMPVVGSHGKVTGVVGAGVDLPALSRAISRAMGLTSNDLFWAVDAHGSIALHSDVAPIFQRPAGMSPALQKVMHEMLARPTGAQTYAFGGRTRSVIYTKSAYSGWIYGFGVVH